MAGLVSTIKLQPNIPSGRSGVRISYEDNTTSASVSSPSDLSGVQQESNGAWITLYRMPTENNPDRCLVHLADHRYGTQGFPVIQEIQIRINVPKVTSYPRNGTNPKNVSPKLRSQPRQLPKKTSGSKGIQNTGANTEPDPQYIVIDKNTDLHEVSIPVGAKVAFVSKAWASQYPVYRTESYLPGETFANATESNKLTPVQSIGISQVDFGKLGLIGKSLKSQYSRVFGTTVGVTKGSIEFVTNSSGTFIYAKGTATTTDYDNIQTWYRKSGTSDRFETLGTVSVGEKLEIPLHGKYDFITAFYKMGALVSIDGKWYQENLSVNCRFNPAIGSLKLIQVEAQQYAPIYDMSKLETTAWDYFTVTSSDAVSSFYKSNISDWNSISVSIYDQDVRVDFYRVLGSRPTLINSAVVPLKKNFDNGISSYSSLNIFPLDEDNNLNISITLNNDDDGNKWALLDSTDSTSTDNPFWRQAVNQQRWIPYLRVIEHYGAQSKELAYVNCAITKPATGPSNYSIVDASKCSDVTVDDNNNDGYNVLVRLNLPIRKGAHVEARLHKYTAGIDHVYRQKQDYRLQRSLASSQGSKARKTESIWFTEHPAMLNDGKIVPEQFSQKDRIYSGSEECSFLFIGDNANTMTESMNIGLSAYSFYRVSNDGTNVHSIDYIHVTSSSMPSEQNIVVSVKRVTEGDESTYQIGIVAGPSNIDVWIPVDKTMASIRNDGNLFYRVQINSHSKDIMMSEFTSARIFKR